MRLTTAARDPSLVHRPGADRARKGSVRDAHHPRRRIDADHLVDGDEQQDVRRQPAHGPYGAVALEGGEVQDALDLPGDHVDNADLTGRGVGHSQLGRVGGEGRPVRRHDVARHGDPFPVRIALVAQEGVLGEQRRGQGVGRGHGRVPAGGLRSQQQRHVTIDRRLPLRVGQDPGLGGGRRITVRPAALLHREGARQQSHEQQDRRRRQHPAQPAVLAGLDPCALLGLLSLAVGQLVTGGDEVVFAGRQRQGSGDLVGRHQPGPAVQGGLVGGIRLPFVGGLAKSPAHSDGVAVVVDPRRQAGPFPQERLVRDLDGGLAGHRVVVGDDQRLAR